MTMTFGIFFIVGLILLCLLVLVFWDEIPTYPMWKYEPVKYDRPMYFKECDDPDPLLPGDDAIIREPTVSNFTQLASDSSGSGSGSGSGSDSGGNDNTGHH